MTWGLGRQHIGSINLCWFSKKEKYEGKTKANLRKRKTKKIQFIIF